MRNERLNRLNEQINFLIDLEQDSLDECLQEFGSLMVFLEQAIASVHSDEAAGGLEVVRKALQENYESMKRDHEEDLDYLERQRNIVEHALSVKDDAKRDEIEKIIMEDVGELAELNQFKKDALEASRGNREEFLNMIADIKDSISEGSIDELSAIFQATMLDDEDGELEFEDEEEESDQEDQENSMHKDADCDCDDEDDEGACHEGNFDLDKNDKIIEFFKKIGEPIITSDEEKK